MRTAQKNPPAREKLLDKAQALMLERGFEATSVDDICKAARLTKGSFFHYFKSKDELGRVLLERFCCEGEALHKRFMGGDVDPLKRVLCYVDSAIACSKDPVLAKGCLLGLFAQELSDAHPEIRRACCRGFEGWAAQLASEMSKAKAHYAPKAVFNPKSVARHFIAVLEGALILAKTERNPKAVEEHLLHFKAYLKGLFGK